MLQICFVPNCTNTSDTLPKKIFVTVPKDKHRRQLWYEAIGRPYVSCTHKVCCEDHFNLEFDAKNWMYYKTVGSRLCLKEDVVPHKFDGCGDPKKGKIDILPALKRRKRNNVDKREFSREPEHSVVEDPPLAASSQRTETDKLSIVENPYSIDESFENVVVTENIPGVCMYMNMQEEASEQEIQC